MTKDIGRHAVFSAPYTLLPSVEAVSTAKPTRKTIKKIEEQSQLRMEIKKYNPGLSSFFLQRQALTTSSNSIHQLRVDARLSAAICL